MKMYLINFKVEERVDHLPMRLTLDKTEEETLEKKENAEKKTEKRGGRKL